jgi:putative transposon-encoded protein
MGAIDKIPLEPGEAKIDTWTLLYQPPKGGKYNGKLLVTNRRLIYDAQFDMSIAGFIEEALFIKFGSEGVLVIPKDRIAKVDVQKSFLAKKVLLTLDDGQVHTFNYGMLNIDPVAQAIQKR